MNSFQNNETVERRIAVNDFFSLCNRSGYLINRFKIYIKGFFISDAEKRGSAGNVFKNRSVSELNDSGGKEQILRYGSPVFLKRFSPAKSRALKKRFFCKREYKKNVPGALSFKKFVFRILISTGGLNYAEKYFSLIYCGLNFWRFCCLSSCRG